MISLTEMVVGLGGLGVLFAAAFVLAHRLDNYGTVDVVWSYAFALVAGGLAWASDGWEPRRLLLAVTVGLWSIRLGTHLARRVAAHHPQEDARYAAMRERWRGRFGWTMFGFFQLQAVSVAMLAVPFALAAGNAEPAFAASEFVAVGIWLVALAGESTADAQLAAFKRRPGSRGRVCDVGLWAWSRHPNYFFEWLVWVAFALLAWPADLGWLGWIAPATILFLLLRVTGIPLTEEQAVRTKGEAYRRYQASTNRFLPWPPRRRPLSATH